MKKIAFLGKPFLAVSALEALLPGVRPLVRDKMPLHLDTKENIDR